MSYASTRYVLVVLPILLAANLTMFSMALEARRTDTCRDFSQLLSTDDLEAPGYTARLGENAKDAKPKRNPRLDGYLQPENKRDSRLSFTIRRSFQTPNWMVRPTIAMPGPPEPVVFKEVVIDVDGTLLPIQIAYGMQRGDRRFAAYTMAYGPEPIVSPFWRRMREAPASLFHGIQPITYIGVAGVVSHVDATRHEQTAKDFIVSGWRKYRRACGG
ncbi:MAG: hypothetical protein VX246_05090 [Myxococcota bacterium]|nr:hypothetical protein [Myxococcota bacterium]